MFRHNTKYIIQSLIVVCVILLIVMPNIDAISKKSGANFTQFNSGIYFAGLWVRDNTDENTLIVSDLMSQEIVAGLANRHKIRNLLKSRYFPDKYPEYNQIVSIFSTTDANDAYKKISDLKKSETMFGYPTLYNTAAAIDETNLTVLVIVDKQRMRALTGLSGDDFSKAFEKFSDVHNFKHVYLLDDIYIYELNK